MTARKKKQKTKTAPSYHYPGGRSWIAAHSSGTGDTQLGLCLSRDGTGMTMMMQGPSSALKSVGRMCQSGANGNNSLSTPSFGSFQPKPSWIPADLSPHLTDTPSSGTNSSGGGGDGGTWLRVQLPTSPRTEATRGHRWQRARSHTQASSRYLWKLHGRINWAAK